MHMKINYGAAKFVYSTTYQLYDTWLLETHALSLWGPATPQVLC